MGGVWQHWRACRKESIYTRSVNIYHKVPYKEVCGRVHGIQFGSPDAFDYSKNSVEDNYLDGISITRGLYRRREHIYSLPAGTWEGLQCPCDTGSSQVASSFVGNDYICESGNPGPSWEQIYYTNDTLWDGQQCGGDEAPCCSTSPYSPYFYKNLGTYSYDYIEIRILTNQDVDDEDILLSYFEIYVK